MENFMLLDAGLGNLVIFVGGMAIAGFGIGGLILVIKSISTIRNELKNTWVIPEETIIEDNPMIDPQYSAGYSNTDMENGSKKNDGE